MMKKIILPVAAVFAMALAAPARATTFQLDSFSVTMNSVDPGLVLCLDAGCAVGPTTPFSGPVQFDLSNAGDTFSTALFQLGTNETALNLDDLAPKALDVAFNFGLPSLGYTPTSLGVSGAAWFLQSFGYAAWSNPLDVAFGSTGLLAVSLSDVAFALPGSAPVSATFTLVRADSGLPRSVPEPASAVLLGLGLIGLAGLSKTRRLA